MITYDFGFTGGVSQSAIRKTLEGNKIHTVTFDGCEYREIKGKQDPSKVFHVLDIKFSNDEGIYTDTIWEPTEQDAEDVTTPYLTPSRVKHIMLKFKHLIDAVNPTLAAKINKKETNLSAPNWEGLCKLIVAATDPGKGMQVQIKLLTNNKGESTFPLYFAAYNKDGNLYMNTNFIGQQLFFTTKELNKITAATIAKPTNIEDLNLPNISESAVTTKDIDFNF